MNNGFVKYVLFLCLFLSAQFLTAQEQMVCPDSNEYKDKKTLLKKFENYLDEHHFLDTCTKFEGIARDFLELTVGGDYKYKIIDESIPKDEDPDSANQKWIKEFASYAEKLQKERQIEQQIKHIALVGCIILLVLLVIITFCLYRKRKKAKTGIVVRNVTTTVLKKQCLDDVANNENYLIIKGKEFSDNTAIRKIYIKNECVKGIYEMYAEDIRKSEKPNENGCMVLGRWVYNQDDNKYDVSLEELVFPGNDAVFSQYEISFGGIIKMKIFDRLRQLRQETDLQYDVTCWVHSHPNLGVFFSKADCNAHLQMKQSSHPHFLTAFVVDILTPTQELGIFTFQQDGNIDLQAELKHLYSLKEWYKWASESENKSFRIEDYYNTLSDTKNHDALCHSIHISDKAIGAICEVAVNNDEILRLVYGSSGQNSNGETEYVADILSRDFVVPDKELVGAFVVDLYCSIPSVRKAIADYLDNIKFVLVYSASNKILTSIPVIDNDLCEEISCYGEQKLEDLILWTKRKD